MAQAPSKALEMLIEMGRLLSSKLDMGDLLKTILEMSSRVVEAESASLLLLDEKTGELYFDVALGLGEKAAAVRLRLGQGIAGSVARSLKPEIIPDVRKDARWSPSVDTQSGFTTRSILAAPMILKGRLIGVVEAINKRGGGFTLEDLRTFEAFASQAAIAIENARLFSSVKEEKQKLDTIFAEMTDGALLADERGVVLLANGAARRLLGLERPGSSLSEAFSGFSLTPSLHEMETAAEASQLFAAAREQPKRLILAGRMTRIRLGETGGARQAAQIGRLCVFRDDTEEWQKERLKRSFLSLISHKLKTPLAAVTGFSDILLEELSAGGGSPQHVKAMTTVVTQAHKLSDLVDKLLRYTTLDNPDRTLELALCPVDGLVEEALKDMKRWLEERKAAVAVSGTGSGAAVLGDRVQLVEVVKNLVENAVKFDPKPAQVTVAVEVRPGDVVISVRDKGPGIPPEDQEKVFTRFHQIETYFTGQVDGWGLGLPYVKKIVGNHGGKVELKSRLGEGTVVLVILPRKA